jgi:hypothetical protein
VTNVAKAIRMIMHWYNCWTEPSMKNWKPLCQHQSCFEHLFLGIAFGSLIDLADDWATQTGSYKHTIDTKRKLKKIKLQRRIIPDDLWRARLFAAVKTYKKTAFYIEKDISQHVSAIVWTNHLFWCRGFVALYYHKIHRDTAEAKKKNWEQENKSA